MTQSVFVAGVGMTKFDKPGTKDGDYHDWAREAGVRKLELHVFPWNDAAIALYDAFGFEREGYRKRHYRRGGEFVDAILMAYAVE